MKIDKYKKNKGGGANTTLKGKSFEEYTNNVNFLLNNNYKKYYFNENKKCKYNYYLYKNNNECKEENKKIIYCFCQNSFKKYIKLTYNIDIFRCPDEAYIIEYNDTIIIKILEKKAQNMNGSVETKLWSGPSLKREYELVLGDKFKIEYCFCINNFLKNKIISNEKKYIILNQILLESKIEILFGEDNNYFDLLIKWINKID